MKKVAIGCLIVLAVGCVAAAGVGYYIYGKAKASYAQLKSTATQFAELGKIPQIEDGEDGARESHAICCARRLPRRIAKTGRKLRSSRKLVSLDGAFWLASGV